MKKITAGIIFFLSGLQVVLPQEKETNDRRYLGAGIRASVFQISELPWNLVPPNRIIVHSDPFRYLRLELHYGLYRNEEDRIVSAFPSGNAVLSLQENAVLFGGGIFGIYPVENIRFIAGLRLSLNKYDQDNISYTTPGTPIVVVDRGEMNITAGVFGGEYFFNKWFSVGAEFSIVNMKNTYDPWDAAIPTTKSKTLITESGLLFRFYPF